MNLVLQNAIAVLVVIAAVGYVLRQVWRAIGNKRIGCGGGCRSCAVNDDSSENSPKPFVSADDLTKSYRG